MSDLLLRTSSTELLRAITITITNCGSYILSGESGLGLTTLARSLAAKRSGRTTNDPDSIVLGDGTASTIGMPQIRELLSSLQYRAHSAAKRTVVIDGAEHLTHEAQNALLKTLEEPPRDTVFLLVTHDLRALLPTTRSRGQLLEFNRPAADQLLDYLTQMAIGQATDRRTAVELSGGLPAVAIALLCDPTQLESYLEISEAASRAPKQSRLDALAMALSYYNDQPRTLLLINRLKSLIPGPAELDHRQQYLAALLAYERRRSANVGPRPALEGLLLGLRA
jgi:DNA polymerase III subunit delta'